MDVFFFSEDKKKRYENTSKLEKMFDKFMIKYQEALKNDDQYNARFYLNTMNKIKQAIRDNMMYSG